MLESLLVSSADCHDNHTVLTILVLKIGTIPNNWCKLIVVCKNSAL